MSLTPKNWNSFQHYKDRSPAWIKLHRLLLDDFAFSRLPVASRALAPLLWLLASEYEGGKITASNEEIAFRFRMTEVELEDGLIPLIESGFFVSDSKLLARRKRGACLEKEGEKQERGEKEIRAVASATRPTRDDFQKFKEAYPRRGAANPWQPASKLFEQAVKSGRDPGMIIAAANSYAVECDKNKITGTDKVAQAQTWLRQARYDDYAPAAPTTRMLAPNSPEWHRERVAKLARGEKVSFMDAQAEKGNGWPVPLEQQAEAAQ